MATITYADDLEQISVLGSQSGQLEFRQIDENFEAEVVLIHDPALPNWMGSLHPNGSLYERPLDLKAAKAQHLKFKKELEKCNIKVLTLRNILASGCDTNVVERVKLEDLAHSCLAYQLIGDASQLTDKETYLMSDSYKKEVIEAMDTHQLVEIVLTQPTIYLKKVDKDTELSAESFTFAPLSNLVFCRDQLITTGKGVIIARPRAAVRAAEVEVTKYCLNKIKIPVVGEIRWPGTLEGGDFFPAGEELCFVGVGLRSNIYAAFQLMESDLLGTRKVAVVKDYFDQDQQRMHLDTIFNIIGNRVCLLLESVVGTSSHKRRLVDEYVRVGPAGQYRLSQHDVEFSEYLKRQHYKIIYCSDEMQRSYGLNGLNLGNNQLLTVDRLTAKHIARSGVFTGRIIVTDFNHITSMYGGVHCCSQVLSRRHPTRAQRFEQVNAAAKLACAAKFNNNALLQDLIFKYGLDPSSKDYDDRTALHIAAREGQFECVRTLLEANAKPNCIDNWNLSPLDEALKSGNQDVIELLLRHGAMKGCSIVAKKLKEHVHPDGSTEHAPDAVVRLPLQHQPLLVTNSTNAAIMVAPNNFNVNLFAVEDNIFMSGADSEFKKAVKTDPQGCRGVYHQILSQFAEFHRVLVDEMQMEIFVFTHELFEMIPDAVFIYDWFSTHSATEQGTATLVLYALKAPPRRLEKRDYLIKFLTQFYPNLIDLSPCEHGSVVAGTEHQFGRATYPEELGSERSLVDARRHIELFAEKRRTSLGTVAGCKPIEHSSIVMDRMRRIAYAANPLERLDLDALDLWASSLNYSVISFDLSMTQHHDRAVNHHTRAWLCIGTNFAILCTEMVSPDDRERVKASISAEGARQIVEISFDQALAMAANGAQEVMMRDGRLGLLLSATARRSLLADQYAILESCVDKVAVVDITLLETLGGGSVSGLLGLLF